MSTAPRLGLHRILLVILCPFVLPSLAQAQNPNTSVPATVLDANNQPLIGAVVVVKDPVTNTGTVSAPTDGQGKTVVSTGNIPQGGVLFKWYLCPGKPPTIFAVRPNDRRPCQDAEFIGLAPLQPGLTTSIVITPTSIIASTGDNSFIASIGSDVTAFANGKEVPNPIGTEPTAAQAIPPPPPGTTSIPFTVTDVNNQPLPGATVVVKDPVSNTGTVSAPTDDQGKTIVSTGNVPAGGVLFTWYLCPGPPPKIFAVRPNQPRPCQDAEFIGLVPLQPGLTQSVLIGPTAVLSSTGPDTFIVSVGTDITAFVNGKEIRSPIVAGPLAHPQPTPASQETPAAPQPAPGTYTKPPLYPPLTARCPQCQQFADKYNLYAAFLNDDYTKKTNLQKSMDITRQAIADREKQIAGLQQQSGASSDPAVQQQISELQAINAGQQKSLENDQAALQQYDSQIAADTAKLKAAEAALKACKCPEPTETAQVPSPKPPPSPANTSAAAKTPDEIAKEAGLSSATGTATGDYVNVYGHRIYVGLGAKWRVDAEGNIIFSSSSVSTNLSTGPYFDPHGVVTETVISSKDGKTSVSRTVYSTYISGAGPSGVVEDASYTQTINGSRTDTTYQSGKQETQIQTSNGSVTITVLPPGPDYFFGPNYFYLVEQTSTTPDGSNTVEIGRGLFPDTSFVSVSLQIEAIITGLNLPKNAAAVTPNSSCKQGAGGQVGCDIKLPKFPEGKHKGLEFEFLATHVLTKMIREAQRPDNLPSTYSISSETTDTPTGTQFHFNFVPKEPSTTAPQDVQSDFEGITLTGNLPPGLTVISKDGCFRNDSINGTLTYFPCTPTPAPNGLVLMLPQSSKPTPKPVTFIRMHYFSTGANSGEVWVSPPKPATTYKASLAPFSSGDRTQTKITFIPTASPTASSTPNGTWSLYIDNSCGGKPNGYAAGWCVNFTEKPVSLLVGPGASSSNPVAPTSLNFDAVVINTTSPAQPVTSACAPDCPTNTAAVTITQTLLLFPFVTNSNGFDTGLEISKTSVEPFSPKPSPSDTIDASGQPLIPNPAPPTSERLELTPPAHYDAEDITPKPEANPRPNLQLRFNSVQITNVTTSITSEQTFDYSKLQFNYSVKPTQKGKQPQAVESIVADLAQQSPSGERGLDASLHRPLPDHQDLRDRVNPYLQQAAFHSGIAPQAVAPGSLVRLVPRSQSNTQAAPQVGVPISFSFIANGNASGEAFELRVVDPSGKLQEIRAPDGLILEPLERGSVKPVSAGPGERLVRRKLNAYCVKYDEDPPEPDAVYRVAAPEIQEHYRPIRAVMRAGRELAAAGKFHPDSDATTYNIAIRQYAIWTKLENWSEQKFGEVFLEKTRKIAADSKVEWNKQMDQALRALIPGRWRDISLVLEEARKLDAASQAAGAPPAPAH